MKWRHTVVQPEPAAGNDREAVAAVSGRDRVAQKVTLPQDSFSDVKRRQLAAVASPEGRGRFRWEREGRSSVNQQDVEVRIAAVDGADRMVYNDARDRKGWREPLALGSAESEIKHRNSSDHVVSTSEPRAVITALAVTAHGPVNIRGSASSGLTPYNAGKASIASKGFAGPTRAADAAKEQNAQPRIKSASR